MAIYTLLAFLSLLDISGERKDRIYTGQILCMFVVHFVAFAAICLESSNLTYIIFYGFQQILLFAVIALFRAVYKEVDKLVLNNMCMLLAIGFVILTRLNYNRALRQFAIVTVSLVIGMFIPLIFKHFKYIHKFTWVFGGLGMLFLLAVLITGAVIHGAKLNYSLFGRSFQPSEFVKILFVFFIAGILAEYRNFTGIVISGLCACIHIVILVFSKDLGSALILFVTYVMMIFASSGNLIYLGLGAAGGTLAGFIGAKLFSHVRVRLEAWLDPWNNIDSTGYQITQSLFAIGTGGWFGMGLYQGDPTSIPYVEEDFIFSAVAEEMGVFFSICLILVCLSCFISFMKLAINFRNVYYRLITAGLAVVYMFQIFLTIGGGTRLIPLTGVTLPLISSGGSSILTTIILFSLIQGFNVLQAEEKERYEEEY